MKSFISNHEIIAFAVISSIIGLPLAILFGKFWPVPPLWAFLRGIADGIVGAVVAIIIINRSSAPSDKSGPSSPAPKS